AYSQPRAARPELFDDTNELVAGRERGLRGAREVRAGAQLRIGERNAGREDVDAHLARPRSRSVLLHHGQDLWPADTINDDTLHALNVAPAPSPRIRSIPRCRSVVCRTPETLLADDGEHASDHHELGTRRAPRGGASVQAAVIVTPG